MGNNSSSLFSTKQVPKHLKPLKKKKKSKPQQEIGQAIVNHKPSHKDYIRDQNGKKIILNPLLAPPLIKINEMSFDNKDDAELAQEETILVGSGPRSAFRWFKGRRYLNYATQVNK